MWGRRIVRVIGEYEIEVMSLDVEVVGEAISEETCDVRPIVGRAKV